MNPENCVWKQLNKIDKDCTSCNPLYSNIVTTQVAMVCLSYIGWCIQKKNMKHFIKYPLRYDIFNKFMTALHLRMIAPRMCRFIFAQTNFHCVGCGYIDTFLDVFQIELLTHLCIERYVVAKYINRGWPINKGHYKSYLTLCIVFSLLYSILPLLGIGGYMPDFDCQSCVFNMIIPDDWTKCFVLSIWLLRSVKPVIFMIVSLFRSQILDDAVDEKSTTKTKNSDVFKKTYYSQLLIWIFITCMSTWVTFAAVRGYVLLSQMMLHDEMSKLCILFIDIASSIYEMTPAFVFITTVLVGKAFHGVMQDEDETKENDKKE